MHLFLLIAGIVCVVAWLYLLLLHGRFWMVQRFEAGLSPLSSAAGLITVVIPARNEADVIVQSVTSLLQQGYPGPLHIFIVDDNSTDGTAAAASAAAESSDHGAQLTVITGKPLPPGWSGKLWAVQQGVEQALLLKPKFLLLTDADIWHSQASLATLSSVADNGKYDLASFMVKLHCRRMAEKLLIPAFVFFFFLLYPPDWTSDPRRKTAGAAGGCILIRLEALERAGGIAAIRHEIIDDCALAAAVKRNGGKVWLGVTRDTHSLRAYKSFGEVERMIARSAFNQLRHSALLLTGAIVGLALLYLLPLGLLLSSSHMLVGLGAIAVLMTFTAYLPMVRFYGLNLLWALTLPLSATFYMIATVDSALKYWSGKGGEWKGRAQDIAT